MRLLFRHLRIFPKFMDKSGSALSANFYLTGPSSKNFSHETTQLPDFLLRTEKLLQLEKEAEYEQNKLLIESHNLDQLCNAGVALKKLRLLDRRTGLGGRLLLKFGYNATDRPLPNHKLSPGDIINLCSSTDYRAPLSTGVVSKVVEHAITLAIDDKKSVDNDGVDLSFSSCQNRTFTIVQSVSDVTFRRLSSTLKALNDYKKFPGWILVEYFFGLRQLPILSEGKGLSEIDDKISRHCFNDKLNIPQRLAIDFCLSNDCPISIVHGPPGTGKTTVVVEIIRQLVKRGKKILACAPSNVAVDNLIEKLVSIDHENCPVQIVRLGHPARTHPNIQKHSLDLILKQKEYSAILDDIKNDIQMLENEKNRRLANSRRKALKFELFEREKAAVRTILQNANVVCGTLTSITREGPLGHLLNDDDEISLFANYGRRFDVAVVDECGQATELACWAALLAVSGEKCILAGDHKQLPPTIISEEAAKGGFDRSLMARATEELGDGIVKMLTVQYRMNTEIMDWPSENVYCGRLEADESVASHLLKDLSSVEMIEETERALWLVDTSDCDTPEIVTIDDESKANIGEVRLVFLHVDRLVRAGVPQKSIAIISPYNLQVQLLRTYVGGVYPEISIRSVDGFQGQEREAVVLSLVRSNERGEVGFLADARRMNVAITRAKRHLAVVCDGRTVSSDPFLRSLIDYFSNRGTAKSALEYEDDYHKVPFSIELDGLTLASHSSSAPKTEPSTVTVATKHTNTKKATKKQKSKEPLFISGKDATSVADKANLELQNWRRGLRDQLMAFLLDKKSIRLEFPASLLAHQRAFIHETAEQMGLLHSSENEGKQRRIIVQKPSTLDTQKSPAAEKSDSSNFSEEDSSAKNAQLDWQSHQSYESKKSNGQTKPLPEKSSAKEKTQVVQSVKSKSIDQASPALDDEELMEKFAQEERHCKFAGCNEATGLVGEKCRFCIQIFCLKHAMAEIHGCGEAAKKHARLQFQQASSGASSMMKKNSSGGAEKRERLQAKLDDKLKNMKKERQQKKSK